jgi:hypothetical protein
MVVSTMIEVTRYGSMRTISTKLARQRKIQTDIGSGASIFEVSVPLSGDVPGNAYRRPTVGHARAWVVVSSSASEIDMSLPT